MQTAPITAAVNHLAPDQRRSALQALAHDFDWFASSREPTRTLNGLLGFVSLVEDPGRAVGSADLDRLSSQASKLLDSLRAATRPDAPELGYFEREALLQLPGSVTAATRGAQLVQRGVDHLARAATSGQPGHDVRLAHAALGEAANVLNARGRHLESALDAVRTVLDHRDVPLPTADELLLSADRFAQHGRALNALVDRSQPHPDERALFHNISHAIRDDEARIDIPDGRTTNLVALPAPGSEDEIGRKLSLRLPAEHMRRTSADLRALAGVIDEHAATYDPHAVVT